MLALTVLKYLTMTLNDSDSVLIFFLSIVLAVKKIGKRQGKRQMFLQSEDKDMDATQDEGQRLR